MSNFFKATYLKNNYLTIDEKLIKSRGQNFLYDNLDVDLSR